MEKAELLGAIKALSNNIRMVYIYILMTTKEFPNTELIDTEKTNDEIYSKFKELLSDSELFSHSIKQLLNCTYRSAFREIFELTNHYCEKTNQTEILKTQDWFHFWRVLRNSLSHDFKIKYGNFDRRILPISWNDIELNLNLDGKELTQELFSTKNMWDLLSEVNDFIKTELK